MSNLSTTSPICPNQAFEDCIGIKKADVIGKTVYDVAPRDLAGIYHAADKALFKNPKTQTYETAVQYADGTRREAIFNQAVFYKQDGSPGGLVGAIIDITEHKSAEEALRLFRSLIDQTKDSIEVIDPETGQFLDVNEKACQDCGYTREEYLKLRVVDVDPQVAARPWEETSDEIKRSGTYIIESQHQRKDGSRFPVEVNATYVRLERDYFLAVVRDITERQQAEAELRRHRDHLEEMVRDRTAELVVAKNRAEAANRAKSNFLANMSHELRTPLNAILGYTQILKRGKNVSEKQVLGLNTIAQSGEHLLTLIDDVLYLARVEAGKLTLNQGVVNLPVFLRVIADIVRVKA